MLLEAGQYVLGAFSGTLIGFTLGLVGGGGSILAVPLLVYLVGVDTPHVAIGTSAFAVGTTALVNLLTVARRKIVKWRCALTFALAGVLGAVGGSSLGKAVDGQRLLFLFALLMFAVAILMIRGRNHPGKTDVECGRAALPKLSAFGAATGLCSGFFGIGGGFLIVPGLMTSTGMPMGTAVASSLVSVAAFGLSAAANYAYSGLVDWFLAAALLGGGFVGGLFGSAAGRRLAVRKGALNIVFALLVSIVAGYMMIRSGSALLASMR